MPAGIFLIRERLCKLGILFILLVIVLTKSTSGLGIALTVIIIGECLLRVLRSEKLCSMVWLVALIVFLEYMRVSGVCIILLLLMGVEIWQKFLPIFRKSQ